MGKPGKPATKKRPYRPRVKANRVPPREVNCLGWCGGKFLSPDPSRVRFCPTCGNKQGQIKIPPIEKNIKRISSEVCS